MIEPRNQNKILTYFHDTKNKKIQIKLEIITPNGQRYITTITFKNCYGVQLHDINPHQNLMLKIKTTNREEFYEKFIDYLEPKKIISGSISPINILFSYTDKDEFINQSIILSLKFYDIESEWGLNGFIIAESIQRTHNKLKK